MAGSNRAGCTVHKRVDPGSPSQTLPMPLAPTAAAMNPQTIDAYIETFPAEVQVILQKVRAAIRKAAPDAEEVISYRMPSFKQDGHLVYFGAFKKHIGLFPPVRNEKLRAAASAYAGEKGNLRFPFDRPIPYGLIGRIVKSRVKENLAKSAKKGTGKRRA